MKLHTPLAGGLALVFLALAPPPARAFEVCLEGGPWLTYYLSELEEGHFERVLELTTPLPGQDRAELQKALQEARDAGQLDRGAMARLTIEGECSSEGAEIAQAVAAHGLNPDSIVGYRLGAAYAVLTIVGPPDWFHFVAANLEGL